MTRNLITFLCISLMVAALAACGKKGPVRPKLLPIPSAPAGFTVEQRGESFLLSWGIPDRNQDGSPLTGLQRFEVERMLIRPGEECPECREDFQAAANIDVELPQGARRLDNRLFWWDVAVPPGYSYRYRVLAVTAKGQLGAPAQAMRPFLAPPPPPREVTPSPHDRLVRLSWQPPAESPGEIVGYNVYRRRPGEPVPLLPVTPRPVAAPPFEDVGLENGQVYLYSVATVTELRKATAESTPSAEVEAVPQEGQ